MHILCRWFSGNIRLTRPFSKWKFPRCSCVLTHACAAANCPAKPTEPVAVRSTHLPFAAWLVRILRRTRPGVIVLRRRSEAPMSENALLKALYETIAPARVYTDQQTLSVLARDALHPGRLPGWSVAQPLCVVRPEHTAEVAAVIRFATLHRLPIIPVGGGSGLMGGAASVVPGLVLDLRGLQEIHIRPADRMAEAGAGVTIQALNQAAAPHGLMCAHDPWTVAVATVGGTIGTNSLGYLGGKYGAMGDQGHGGEAVR